MAVNDPLAFNGTPRLYHFDPLEARSADRELHVQVDILAMVKRDFPLGKTAAIPNGAFGKFPSARARAEGFSDGFPDLVILGPVPITQPDAVLHHPELAAPCVAFVEVKAKADTSQEQHDWLNWMHESGHHCGVFRHHETLARKLRDWGFQARRR